MPVPITTASTVREEETKALCSDTVSIKKFFDRVGPWFYSLFFILVGYRSSLKYFLRYNLEKLNLQEGMRILDVGIGTGFLTVNLLQEIAVPVTIAGLDFSAGMFCGLKKWLMKLGLEESINLQYGNILQMPFRDNTFDLVVSSAAMEYLPDVKTGIFECCRVLRPGGRILIVTTRNSLVGKLIAFLWKNIVLEPTYIKACLEISGISVIEKLKFPWYFPHVNWWGSAFIGEKGVKRKAVTQ